MDKRARLRASSVYIRDRQAVTWSLETATNGSCHERRPQSRRILRQQVTLELESIDRMYLNLYVPQLQHERGVVTFFLIHARSFKRRLPDLDRRRKRICRALVVFPPLNPLGVAKYFPHFFLLGICDSQVRAAGLV